MVYRCPGDIMAGWMDNPEVSREGAEQKPPPHLEQGSRAWVWTVWDMNRDRVQGRVQGLRSPVHNY